MIQLVQKLGKGGGRAYQPQVHRVALGQSHALAQQFGRCRLFARTDQIPCAQQLGVQNLKRFDINLRYIRQP